MGDHPRFRDSLSATGYTFGDAAALSAGAFAPALERAGSFLGTLSKFDSLASGRDTAIHHSPLADETMAAPVASTAHTVAALTLSHPTTRAHDAAPDSFVFHPSEHASAHHSGMADAAAISDFASAAAHQMDLTSSLLLEPGARAPHGHFGAQGFYGEAVNPGAHSAPPPTVAAVSGQLWVAFGGPGAGGGNPDGKTDMRIEHADSDGLSNDWVIQQQGGAGGEYSAIGLDTTANVSIALDPNSYTLHVTNLTTGVDIKNTVIASIQDQDVINGFVVNAQTNTIYMDLDGYDYATHGGDIIKLTYDPVTGIITTPYTWNDTANGGLGSGTVDTHGILIDSASTGQVYQDGRAFFLSQDGGTLYYVDDDDNNSGGFWGRATNGIYKVSTSGDVGDGNAPTPQLLSDQNQFPTNDSNGFITGITVDEAKGIIYFTTNGSAEGVNTSQDAIWWMPIAGGTATKMVIPAGVAVDFPVFFGNALTIDPKAQQLYYSDKQTGEIVQFTLSADGHSFTAATNFAQFDTDGGTSHDGGFGNQMVFDVLPTLSSLSATTTEALQGGSAINLLTAAPTVSDIDNFDMRGATITVTNAQTGDNLFVNGAQSGTISGVSVSWNSTTHVLSLSGEASFSTYQTLLDEISYQDSGTDNSTGSHPTRTINFTVSDGITTGHPSTSDSNEQTVVVTIDRAPTLAADSYAVLESATVTGTSGTAGTGVLGNDSDKDGDAIVVTQVNGVAGNVAHSVAGTYGHLTLNANGSYSYVADITSAIDAAATGSHPVDSFTYTVSDGLGGVTTSTVSFTIDRAPTSASDSYDVVESNSATGTAGTGGTGVLGNDSDKDGDGLTITAVNGSASNVGSATFQGTYGHLNLASDGHFTYSADNTSAIDGAATGSHPTDTFTYTVDDGHGGTEITTVTFTIDRAPIVVADVSSSDAVESGTDLTGNVLTNDSDPDGDSPIVTRVDGSAVSSGVAGSTFAGTYGHLTMHQDGSYSYAADNTAAIDAAATGSHLTDTFTYTADDDHGATATTNLTITLDRAPTALADTGSAEAVESGAAVTGNVLTNDSDPDGDSPIVSLVGGSAVDSGAGGTTFAGTYGHLTIHQDGTYSYVADITSAIDTAATGSHLTDTFTYTADDGFGGTATANLVFNLDRAPTLGADSYSLAEGDTISGTAGTGGTGVFANDSDPDGDTLVVSAFENASNVSGTVGNSLAGTYGHLTLNADGSYSYLADITSAIDSAAVGSHPTDSFTYTVDDGHGGTTTQTVSFSIDRAPIANSDLIVTSENAAASDGSGGNANLLANDIDPDTDDNTGITIAEVNGSVANVGAQITLASGALLTVNADGTYTYDPNHVFDWLPSSASGAQSTATDTFTYTINGGSTVTVTVNINGVDSNDTLYGTAADDNFSGGIGNDIFYMQNGGDDIVNGNSGNDHFHFDGALTAADQIDGGTGWDSLRLAGDYSAGVVFNATTMVNVELLKVVRAFNYDLTTSDATVAAGHALIVDATGLLPAGSLTFDGSAETDGWFAFRLASGTQTITGGAGDDLFRVRGPAHATLHGGGGNDVFDFASHLRAFDQVDGGAGYDRMLLNGDYSGGLAFGPTTMTNVEAIALGTGHSYRLTTNDATVAAGATLKVDGSALGSSDTLVFRGYAESDGHFRILGGAGNDNLWGGAGSDVIAAGDGVNTIRGGGGADILSGGAGADTFVYGGVSDSTSTGHDIVRGFDASQDFFNLPFAVTGIDATVSGGRLTQTNFDTQLANAVGASQLLAHHAVLFTPDAGGYAGHTLLVVDANGVAGYQAGQDLVIDLQNPADLNLHTTNFI